MCFANDIDQYRDAHGDGGHDCNTLAARGCLRFADHLSAGRRANDCAGGLRAYRQGEHGGEYQKGESALHLRPGKCGARPHLSLEF